MSLLHSRASTSKIDQNIHAGVQKSLLVSASSRTESDVLSKIISETAASYFNHGQEGTVT